MSILKALPLSHLNSMTAFASQALDTEYGSICIELRSVNHRYLEIFFKLSEQSKPLESLLRERLKKLLKRGKVECLIKTEPSGISQNTLIIDEPLAKQVIDALNWITQEANQGQINPIDVLKWPGVLKDKPIATEPIEQAIISLFDKVCELFVEMRVREGEQIKMALLTRLAQIRNEVNQIREQMPDILRWQREKWLGKLEELNINLDPSRLEQELLFLAQKIDIAEELDRIDMHIIETQTILSQNEAVGRRLDFMMQEFNREANTLAAKSINALVTQSAVEIKVLIEQMREQIQNIE